MVTDAISDDKSSRRRKKSNLDHTLSPKQVSLRKGNKVYLEHDRSTLYNNRFPRKKKEAANT